MSLSSPHLGTLYAESPLVSTGNTLILHETVKNLYEFVFVCDIGMWAILKFKKTPLLNVMMNYD
jgi:hypothetical protein